MSTANSLLEEATRLVRESDPRDINYVGQKPWYERSISKFKYAVAAGAVVGILSGVGLSAMLTNHNSSDDGVIYKQATVVTEVAKENVGQPTAIVQLREDYPSINFSEIKSKRDVAKEFIGKNNFIALAAELEGFRGDLHKDPAKGLNIGFGYNITKRLNASQKEVMEDLSSVGLSKDKIKEIIELAKTPKEELSGAIEMFNKKHHLKKGQLINYEQGVALLRKTQDEYKKFAGYVFDDSFSKMKKNQQEVLTYAAYKVGVDSLSKYKKAIIAASDVYSKEKHPSTESLKRVAKELIFFYQKNGEKMVVDERASLVAYTFIHQDYLTAEIGAHDKMTNSMSTLMSHKMSIKHEMDKKVANKVKSITEKMRMAKNGKSSQVNPKKFS